MKLIVAELTKLGSLVKALLRDGRAVVSDKDPLLQHQSELGLFNEVNVRLQTILGDEANAMNMKPRNGGWIIILNVGETANAPPDFSPPEPRLL
jgi:hypothetical protein